MNLWRDPIYRREEDIKITLQLQNGKGKWSLIYKIHDYRVNHFQRVWKAVSRWQGISRSAYPGDNTKKRRAVERIVVNKSAVLNFSFSFPFPFPRPLEQFQSFSNLFPEREEEEEEREAKTFSAVENSRNKGVEHELEGKKKKKKRSGEGSRRISIPAINYEV